ncbi:hypothetical protein ACFLT7_04860 [candidate division KSB1 bacterium]
MIDPLVMILIVVLLVLLFVFGIFQFAFLLTIRTSTRTLIETFKEIDESQKRFLERLNQLQKGIVTIAHHTGANSEKPQKNPEVLKIEKQFLQSSYDSDRDKSYAYYNCSEALFREGFLKESYRYTKACLRLNTEHQSASKLEAVLKQRLGISASTEENKDDE